MKKNNINFFNETLYTEKLDNGLEVYILPNENVEDTFVSFTSRYGGANFSFMLNKKYVSKPNGIAHFLEHKMFEQKNGIDPFLFFGHSGTYCNAVTNYFNTSYIFAGNKNINENINYLLDFVQSPYFTDENVLKEKGIITEEIKMYEDMPDRVIYEKIIYNLFINHPVKYSIGGTVSDITNITKKDLYDCYNTFYQPSNMFVTITGNVNIDECINLIKENQDNKKLKDSNIKLKNIKEPNEVSIEEEIINYKVAIPYVAYGIKIPTKTFKNIDSKKLNMYIFTILNLLFDDTSIFYEEAKDEDIIDTPIEIESLDTKEHKIFIFLFKSKKYRDVINKINITLKNINISEEELERKKKVYISNMLFIFDNISESNRIIVNDIILYDKFYYNIVDVIKDMNIDELNNIIKNIEINNKSILIIEDKNS